MRAMRRRLVLTLASAAAVLLVGELATRAIADDLPAVLEWHSAEAEHKVEQMEDLGDADVVFLGSSLTNAGFVPETLVNGLAATGRSVVAYNAGLSACIPMLTELWAEEVVLPRLHPEVVVLGLSSFDFTDHPSADVFVSSFASSPAGERAVGDDGVLDRLDHWLDDRSELWRHKVALRNPDSIFDAIRGRGPLADPQVAAMDAFGRTGYLQTQRFEDRIDDGGVGVPIETWSLGRRNPAALERVVTGLRDQGITVVLVDMPVTDEYVLAHPGGAADYEVYLRYLRAFAERVGAPLIEMSGVRDHALFADEIHLNIDGATQLTNALVARITELNLLPPG